MDATANLACKISYFVCEKVGEEERGQKKRGEREREGGGGNKCTYWFNECHRGWFPRVRGNERVEKGDVHQEW